MRKIRLTACCVAMIPAFIMIPACIILLAFNASAATNTLSSNTKAKTNVKDDYYTINKSFDLFGQIVREALDNYVDSLDAESFIESGLNGLVSFLDPYSVFITEAHSDELDFITYGKYVGVGITVAEKEGMLTIVGLHDGYPAALSGVRIGDRIYKIDSTVVLNTTNDELRRYTNGKSGTDINMWVLRDGTDDTLKFELKRDEVHVGNVSYSGIIADSIGYIRIDHFARNTAQEVRDAYLEMIRNHNIKGLILDLRNNPGGLLEAAVGTCELFVPKNSLIVSTRSRQKEDTRNYYSDDNPIDTNIAIAVLINEGSASASEILAGALQDLDRAIIVGEKSYGKGLVQSVFPLAYGCSLKLTTSKYYIPSGRCIQKIEYNKNRKNKTTSSELFKTKKGRTVVESKGIIPDSTVDEDTLPDYVLDLFRNDMPFLFASRYCAKLTKLPADFEVTDKIMSEFRDFLKFKKYQFKSKLQEKINELKEVAKDESLSDDFHDQIEILEHIVAVEDKGNFEKYDEDIRRILYLEIISRFQNEKSLISYLIGDDIYTRTAVALLSPIPYKKFLTVSEPGKK